MSDNTAPTPSDKRAQLRRAALEYHEFPKPGKLTIVPTSSTRHAATWWP
jgi:malate dehydrogenase (oxaloacetate-decarboxylating)(NADP+)